MLPPRVKQQSINYAKTISRLQLSTSKFTKKVNNFSLLGERVPNEKKFLKAKRLLSELRKKVEAFRKRAKNVKEVSGTNIPFFDIEYKTVAKLIGGGEESISDQRELQLFHQNLRFFDRIFGFDFEGQRSLLLVNNQSLITLDHVYPQIRDFHIGAEPGHLLDDSQIKEDSQRKSEGQKLLSEESAIIDNTIAYRVD